MRVLNPSEYMAALKQWESRKARERAEREQASAELAGRDWDAFVRKVAKERHDRAEARKSDAEALARMTPVEAVQHVQRMSSPDAVPGVGLGLPSRYTIALQDIESEERKQANREREQRERDAGLPQAQADWAAEEQAIREECRAAEAEAEQAKRAARERRRAALEELGECPTLESLEAVPS